MKRDKVFWDESERRTVALGYLIQKAAGVRGDAVALNNAQQELPPERRRKILGWSSVRLALEPEMPWARKRLESELDKGRTAAPKPSPLEIVNPLAAGLASAIEDALVASGKRVLMRLLDDPEIRAAVAALVPAPVAAPSATAATAGVGAKAEAGLSDDMKLPIVSAAAVATVRPKLPKIAVIGAIGPQQTDLLNTYEGRVEFRFWTTDQNNSAIKGVCNWCDIAILWTGFIGHSQSNAVMDLSKRQFNGFRVLMCNGSVSACKAIIDRELAGDTQPLRPAMTVAA